MAIPEILNTIEQSGISTWIRESNSIFGFYFILTLHTIGLSLLVGSNAVVDLRILGVASTLPLKPMKPFFKIMLIGLTINVMTGLLLLTGYPTKALTNPFFYLKLTFIALALITLRKMYVRVFRDPRMSDADMIAAGKALAIWSLAFWFVAIAVGRSLSETYRYLTFGHPNLG